MVRSSDCSLPWRFTELLTMPLPLEEFVLQLENSGILAGDTIQNFIPPKAAPRDADELLRELVEQKKLTPYQAEEVAKGNGKSLVLGNYILLEQIGAGGMGQVFKAEHRRMHRIVAVKVLPPQTMKDPATVARFEREITAVSKINHPNIVAAFDADCADGVHYLVMELVEGSDLWALVAKNGPFPIEKAVNCIVQAATGLGAAHAKGIVHRDIKPANLLLDNTGVVKILDMGLARLNGDATGPQQTELTSTGMFMGTVDFMSPEQAMNTKHADGRADIYSLGCSLYFLITGDLTYQGETIIEKILAHREHPIPSLKLSHPEVTEELEAVFRKMVAKKVEDRYQTMAEVVADLHYCATGELLIEKSPASTSPGFQNSAFAFLRDLPTERVSGAKAAQKSAAGGHGRSQTVLTAIGLATLGMAILAGIIVSLQTKEGTLVVEIDQPGATVQVLDAEGKVEITEPGGQGKVSIAVDRGKHRLKIEKAGFAVFGQEFEMQAGGKTPIKAKLVPLDEGPVTVGTKPVPSPTVGEKKRLAFEKPGFDQWVKETAALPAEKQLTAVAKKLQELNPGFDGKLTNTWRTAPPVVENGVVVELSIITDNVTDISPVRVLTGLGELNCSPSTGNRDNFSDLSPLKGMKIHTLKCGWSKVSDLTPLKDVPVTWLWAAGTPISDLSPLNGKKMHLVFLEMCPQLSQLPPFNGLELYGLSLAGTLVADLSPLEGTQVPLSDLNIASTKIKSLAPLKGRKLTRLICVNNEISDLSVLRDMPLKELSCDFNPERDTELLRSIKTLETINGKPAAEFWKEVEEQQKGKKKLGFQMPGFDQWMKDVAAMPAEQQVAAVSKKLVELNPGFDGKVTPHVENGVVTGIAIHSVNMTDISPVRALTELNKLDTGIENGNVKLADLSPLKGMNLTVLSCAYSQVSDLSPLKGMPLKELSCANTKVSDLAPLRGMPLTYVNCQNTLVPDLSPLKDTPLKILQMDFKPERDTEVLRSIKTLENINFKSAEDFWKEVDEKKSQ